MKKFLRLLVVTSGFGVLGFVLSLAPQKGATGAGAAPVAVVNYPATLTGATVPVSGTVNANVTFPSSIAVENASTGSELPVPIPLIQRDVDNPASQPFAADLCIGVTVNCGQAGPETSFTVPASTSGSQSTVRRLVIEYYSTDCEQVAAETTITSILYAYAGGRQNAYFIGPMVADPLWPGHYRSNQQARIYADPGSTLEWNLASIPGPLGGTPTCFMTLSGYLVLE